MMLAAKDGGDALDAELAKHIKGLAGSRTFYDWRIARRTRRLSTQVP
jgi:hypothetical protein